MDYKLNRKITSKDYTDNNEDYCINEHSNGNYQFTENYVRWLEFNYIKNKSKIIIISECVRCGKCTGSKTLTYCNNCINTEDYSDLF